MKNLLLKLAPENKKDSNTYMLMVVAILPLIYITLKLVDYMMLNFFCLIIFNIVFILKFVRAIRQKNVSNFFKNPSFLLLTIMFAWIFFSNIFAYDKVGSWLGFIDGVHQEVSVWQYMFYFVVAICAINIKKENIDYILSLFICVACIMIIVQFCKCDYSYGFIHKNHTGYYLCMTLMLAVGKFFFSKNFRELIFSLLAIILHFVSFVLNGSMGPIIGIIAFFVLGIIYILIHKRYLFVKFLSVFACFMVAFCLFDFTPGIKNLRDESETTIEKLVDIGTVFLMKVGIIDEECISDEEIIPGSDGWGRFDMWERSVENMREFPLFGTGMAWHSYNSDMPNMKPHNEFLQYAASNGIPTLICYVTLMIYLFAKFRKNHKNQSNQSFVIMSAIFVYLVQSVFGNVMPFVAPLFYLLIGFAIKNMDFEKVKIDSKETPIIENHNEKIS